MKKLTILTVLILGTLFATAQFEGVIKFKKHKTTETIDYTYYIKGDKVRIEEYDKEGKLKGIMLIDSKKDEVVALSPERKLYMDATNSRQPAKVNPMVTKTSKKQEIQGYMCTEWLVQSDQEGIFVSYQVIDEPKFSFFEAMLRTLNRKDRLSKYWLETPGIENKFTMVGIEKYADGKQKVKLEVTEMTEEKVSDAMFDIPSDYVKFEK